MKMRLKCSKCGLDVAPKMKSVVGEYQENVFIYISGKMTDASYNLQNDYYARLSRYYSFSFLKESIPFDYRN